LIQQRCRDDVELPLTEVESVDLGLVLLRHEREYIGVRLSDLVWANPIPRGRIPLKGLGDAKGDARVTLLAP
jgi:hypothetical protein